VAGSLTNRLASPCLLKDPSPAVVQGCRSVFIESWTSLDTALSGGLHITQTVPDDEEEAMIAVEVDTHPERPLRRGARRGWTARRARVHGHGGRLCRVAALVRAPRRRPAARVGIESAGSWGAGLVSTCSKPVTPSWRWSVGVAASAALGSLTASTYLSHKDCCICLQSVPMRRANPSTRRSIPETSRVRRFAIHSNCVVATAQ
jgi:hypothetical protein